MNIHSNFWIGVQWTGGKRNLPMPMKVSRSDSCCLVIQALSAWGWI